MEAEVVAQVGYVPLREAAPGNEHVQQGDKGKPWEVRGADHGHIHGSGSGTGGI
jgi:hypothetical protein